MNVEQKHKISKSIVQSLSKIKYYEDAIRKIKSDNRAIYEANMTCRLMKTRSTVWVDLTPVEVIYILRQKIKQERIILKYNENKIK